jgi:hypothetical protein
MYPLEAQALIKAWGASADDDISPVTGSVFTDSIKHLPSGISGGQ